MCVVSGVSPFPPRDLPLFLSRIGFSIPTFHLFTLADFHRILLTHALARSARQLVRKTKSLPGCMVAMYEHTSTLRLSRNFVRLEPTSLTSATTRYHYYIGDADLGVPWAQIKNCV